MKQPVPFFIFLFLFGVCLTPLSPAARAQDPAPQTLDRHTAKTVLARIRTDRLDGRKAGLEARVDSLLRYQLADGSFRDIDYLAQSRSNWEPLRHLSYLTDLGLAYTEPNQPRFGEESLYRAIVRGFEYWDARWPRNTMNWFYNWIAHPRDLGLALIAAWGGKNDITREPVFESLTRKWRENLGRPDAPVDPRTAGANKCDIAMHWIYRACLTRDKEDMDFAVEQSRIPVAFTTGEGIQPDWSYRQHGPQLYLGGYGFEFIQLVTRQAWYLAGTPYALGGDKLATLNGFVLGTYLRVIRGERMNYNVLGRSISRPNRTSQQSLIPVLEMLTEIDTANTRKYEEAILRIRKDVPPWRGVVSSHTHYPRGEYTLVTRPEFTFDIRMASERMARSEYDYYENRQGFFLTDGATCLALDGEEYGTILPLWDWTKIPGTTLPALKRMVRADSYIFKGRSDFAGGVSGGIYGVTAFELFNDQELYAWDDDTGSAGVPAPQHPRLPALDFGARKAWFVFEREIVCLGAGIYSGHGEPVYTTVEQNRQQGPITVSAGGQETAWETGAREFTDPAWVFHGRTACFFPRGGQLHVSGETRSGKWSDINRSFADTVSFTANLFNLRLDHGVKPSGSRYAYLLVPALDSPEEVRNYPVADIGILQNSDTLQAVRHHREHVLGIVFYQPGRFTDSQVTVEADAGCLVLIRQENGRTIVSVSDPRKTGDPIRLRVYGLPNGERDMICPSGEGPDLGSTFEFIL